VVHYLQSGSQLPACRPAAGPTDGWLYVERQAGEGDRRVFMGKQATREEAAAKYSYIVLPPF
jgi:hypothetical protein